jgi:quercetin dioxygenase-like cupin family protein
MVGWKSTAVGIVLCLAPITAGRTAIAQGGKPAAPAGKPAAQAAKPAAPAKARHVVLAADQVKWGPGPPSLPAGAQMAVIDGDPAQKGVPFVIRAKVPDGYRVPPHWHPADENIVVLSGTFLVGMGDKMDQASMNSVGPGGFVKMPANMHHYAGAKGETTFQVHGVGPFAVTYVNPSDDPRKKTTTK